MNFLKEIHILPLSLVRFKAMSVLMDMKSENEMLQTRMQWRNSRDFWKSRSDTLPDNSSKGSHEISKWLETRMSTLREMGTRLSESRFSILDTWSQSWILLEQSFDMFKTSEESESLWLTKSFIFDETLIWNMKLSDDQKWQLSSLISKLTKRLATQILHSSRTIKHHDLSSFSMRILIFQQMKMRKQKSIRNSSKFLSLENILVERIDIEHLSGKVSKKSSKCKTKSATWNSSRHESSLSTWCVLSMMCQKTCFEWQRIRIDLSEMFNLSRIICELRRKKMLSMNSFLI